MFILGSQGPSGYSITNSARFNGTSDYLSKTLTTSATTSGSIWVKRSKLGAVSPIFDNKVYFTSGDALYAFGLTSTALYRDPSAWYHIFWNGTGVYVNGTLVTGTGTYTAASVTNPRLGFDGTNYFSGYLSDFAFWNGTSASLQGGATDSNGVWSARRPSAGYSLLAFGSSGALGTDTSGNGNNWTVSGSPAQTVDTPSNSYCVWNVIDAVVATTTISNGALVASTSGNSNCNNIRGSIGATTGKFYFEVTVTAKGGTSEPLFIGVCNNSYVPSFAVTPTTSPNFWLLSAYNGNKSNGVSTAYGSAVSVNSVIQVAVNLDTGSIWWGVDGTYIASGNPATGTGAAYTNLSGTIFPAHSCNGTGTTTVTANFGQRPFAHTPPTGYTALCTANLPSVAVTTSGTFTGNASADGPFVWTNGNPSTLTINGNAVTFGTHADKTAGGFKLRTSSASYNTNGSNTWTATAGKRFVYSAPSLNNAQGNP